MHELAIAETLVKLVQNNVVQRDRCAVRKVGVRIGELTDVYIDALKFGYQIACQGTVLEGSKLEIESVAISAHCNTCGRQDEIERHLFICSHCGSNDIKVTSGMELDLAWIEIDDADADDSHEPPNSVPVREISP